MSNQPYFSIVFRGIRNYLGKSYKIQKDPAKYVLDNFGFKVKKIYYELNDEKHFLDVDNPKYPSYMKNVMSTVYLDVAGTFGEPEECPICYEDWSKEGLYFVTPCNHWFHISCIKKYLRQSNNTVLKKSCPMCRSLNIDRYEIIGTTRFEYPGKFATDTTVSKITHNGKEIYGLNFKDAVCFGTWTRCGPTLPMTEFVMVDNKILCDYFYGMMNDHGYKNLHYKHDLKYLLRFYLLIEPMISKFWFKIKCEPCKMIMEF